MSDSMPSTDKNSAADQSLLPCAVCTGIEAMVPGQHYIVCSLHTRRPVVPRPLTPDVEPGISADRILNPGCPICGQFDGYLSWAEFQYAICAQHAMWWWIGDCLTNAWLLEDFNEQQKVLDEVEANYRDVTYADHAEVRAEYLHAWFQL